MSAPSLFLIRCLCAVDCLVVGMPMTETVQDIFKAHFSSSNLSSILAAVMLGEGREANCGQTVSDHKGEGDTQVCVSEINESSLDLVFLSSHLLLWCPQ